MFHVYTPFLFTLYMKGANRYKILQGKVPPDIQVPESFIYVIRMQLNRSTFDLLKLFSNIG